MNKFKLNLISNNYLGYDCVHHRFINFGRLRRLVQEKIELRNKEKQMVIDERNRNKVSSLSYDQPYEEEIYSEAYQNNIYDQYNLSANDDRNSEERETSTFIFH